MKQILENSFKKAHSEGVVSPFSNLSQNIKKSLSSHINTKLNSKIADNKEINETGNPDLYKFLKYNLNTIDSNSVQENEQLTQTFANLTKIIQLQNDPGKLAKIKNQFIKSLFTQPSAIPAEAGNQSNPSVIARNEAIQPKKTIDTKPHFSFKNLVNLTSELSYTPL